MGFPWFSKIVDGVIDWSAVEASFDKILEEEQALVMFLEPVLEPWVVDYKDLKFPNEDNWGEDNERSIF